MVLLQRKASASPSHGQDLSSHAQRQVIGYIGLVLPLLLIALVIARDGFARWMALDSISAYYYTGAVAAFVGMLVSLALFLFTYRGYDNECHWADRAAGFVAGFAALGVALFPTEPPDVLELAWWRPWIGAVHFGSAIVLFAMFAVYALWLFRITPGGREHASDEKRRRNAVYLLCGLVIVAGMVWAIVAKRAGGPIFWPESLALAAFAISWLVKGRALRAVGDAARSLMHRFQSDEA